MNAQPLTQAEIAEIWPNSVYGGDGPWNNYGGDDCGTFGPLLPTSLELAAMNGIDDAWPF